MEKNTTNLKDIALDLTSQLSSILKGLQTGDIKSTVEIQLKIQTLSVAVESCISCARAISKIDNIDTLSMLELYSEVKDIFSTK